MKSPAPSANSVASVSKQLAAFIAKFDPKVAYNFFVIGYASTERASDAILSIAAAANGVGLAFLHGASLPDPRKLLLGAGKQNRFIRLPTLEPLRSPDVLTLIRAAVAQARTPFPVTGGGHTVIKSISAKQRPRRKHNGAG